METQLTAMTDYLHGYSESEQDRLLAQGAFLAPYVYEGVDLSKVNCLLEVGCGVGAQTQVLLSRFPGLHITGIDHEAAQIEKAREVLKEFVKQGRVQLRQANAAALPFEDSSFEGAFICWLLEHTSNPVSILQETRRALAEGGVVYCTEVLNTPLAVSDSCPTLKRYWGEFNALQTKMGGNPTVGAELANLLLKAGFKNITTRPIIYHLDSRLAQDHKEHLLDYWKSLFLSAAPELLRANRIVEKDTRLVSQEFDSLKTNPDAYFFVVAMQARAERN